MTYSSDDVQKILQLAMTRKQEESFSGKQLSEMAAELGISSELLETAQQEWLTQTKASKEQEARREILRRGFKAHLISFLAVNTFLVILNLTTTPRDFWAIYPISGWGLGLFMHNLRISRLEENLQDMQQSYMGCKNSKC
ncbi:MAG: 2TM domain-containing protein [Cyanobacteriota bacterium]|nr:2TM domain-containing protein [Cyanobacteriota bacterium]